jgi:predicted NodU family carbamoyl transferase
MRGSVIAMNLGHDASIAVTFDARVELVLELERLFGLRHFETPSDLQSIAQTWDRASAVAIDSAGMHAKRFWRAVLVDPKQVWGATFEGFAIGSGPVQNAGNIVNMEVVGLLSMLVPAEQWVQADHHLSHASLAYHESPFNAALVLSFDGPSPA